MWFQISHRVGKPWKQPLSASDKNTDGEIDKKLILF